ncbi:MAG: 3-oxoacyl-[acyl-carrier-protein] synthase III C-terminal domain-containing protein [Chloroflexota bacterium]|nr:3-oxoacyl-[acyl-carrier-protein] synthase III C-terminal domain-containing protein [Chloroflexota bacterium]
MVGITSYGAHVPYHRLGRSEIARAWGGVSIGGERAVANWDEDSLSMAVEAARDCVTGTKLERIDGLFFASTTSPFKEKQAATMIATAVDLRQDILTMDCASTLRAGTNALKAAADAVKAGSAKQILVTAADCRLGAPDSILEQRFGDGAAAFLVGDTNVIASIEGSYSFSNELTDVWRREQDQFVHVWEDRFIMSQGYQAIMAKTISAAMKKYKLTPQDFAKVVLYATDDRSHSALAKSLGFDAKTQVQKCPFDTVGNTGAAFSLMTLALALETANPGDNILVASYGDGCDVLILKVTPEIKKLKGNRGVSKHIASKKMLSSYEQYLRFRGLVGADVSRNPDVIAPSTLILRERNSFMRFHASKCHQCGEVQWPIQRICGNCNSKDDFDEIPISDTQGTIFTFTEDTIGFTNDLNNLLAVVDFDAGFRSRISVANAEKDELAIGMRIEMTFRKFIREGDVPIYSWKCKPVS